MEPAIEKAENKLEYLSGDEDAMRLYWERERSLHLKNRKDTPTSASGGGIARSVAKRQLSKSLLKPPFG
ncbi:hypothetical protein [uncultured Clostridium sp.]|uniref:hypothetical protein n=1 Tax=uncultured Clostridium sp. TaxID=59620 RepID=UPI002604BB7E|nr:hypothetical protein [uncultured Clostridium sp.]